MKKRFCLYFLTFTAILLCLLALPQTAHAASASALTFTLNETGDGYIVFSRFISPTGVLAIPATYNGLPVTTIGDYAFSYCYGLTGITIPDSVTSIGDYAFDSCTSLTSVSIGNSVTSIGKDAFYNCDNLTSITIPDSVTTIGDGAFSYCPSLTSVSIGNSVTSIGDSAFSSCGSLTSVTIPDSITTIGDGAFSWCSSLCYNVYNNCNYLGNEANPYVVLIDVTNNTQFSYEIHSDTKMIYYFAFSNCTNLTGITIPNSVTSIGNSAFNGCANLTSIVVEEGNPVYHSAGNCMIETNTKTLIAGCKTSQIPADGSVTGIGDYAFFGCSSLTSITIPNSVTSIGYSAFFGCTSLTSVTIPDSVTSIGIWAFSYCASLTSITIPESVTSIGESAFRNSTSLTGITIPDSVTTIGAFVFDGCTRLTSVTYCGTQEQLAAIEIGDGNESLTRAELQFHDMEDGVCTICGFGKGIVGDVDGNEEVTYHDAVYLLLNTLLGEENYPLNGANGDVDGDGTVNPNDAIYLLLHVMFGEEVYPLKG